MKPVRQPRISASKHDQKGLDVREVSLLRRREKYFLLTSPFIEPRGIALLRRQIKSVRGHLPPYRPKEGAIRVGYPWNFEGIVR